MPRSGEGGRSVHINDANARVPTFLQDVSGFHGLFGQHAPRASATIPTTDRGISKRLRARLVPFILRCQYPASPSGNKLINDLLNQLVGSHSPHCNPGIACVHDAQVSVIQPNHAVVSPSCLPNLAN